VALENLLRNAWKFTSRRERAQIRFHAEMRERQIVYCVTDNGAGFDMSFASKLFLPFHRLHGISEFAGTGIGLATVQRVIQRHEARSGPSPPDEGASFSSRSATETSRQNNIVAAVQHCTCRARAYVTQCIVRRNTCPFILMRTQHLRGKIRPTPYVIDVPVATAGQ
jgi:hypothetical protein